MKITQHLEKDKLIITN